MEETFGVLVEEDPEQLDDDELLDEITVLPSFQVLLPHEVHELADELGHQQVQRSIHHRH